MSDPFDFSISQTINAPSVENAIARAASRTGVDFDYLLAQAEIESGLDTDAEARTSSATGLFQFIESTWLETMRRHGGELGYGQLAGAIQSAGGRAHVTDPAMRSQILELRKNPEISSLMAAKLAQDNRVDMLPVLGREPTSAELYLAHFLGSGGANKFLTALQANPDSSAVTLFPRAAQANPAIFQMSGGTDRSLAQVMDLLRGKVAAAMPENGKFDTSLLTGNTASPAAGALAPTPFARARASFATFATDARSRENLPQQPPKISDLLLNSFSVSQGNNMGHAVDHARRAYSKLKALDL